MRFSFLLAAIFVVGSTSLVTAQQRLGDLGAGSVAFGINSRTDSVATTFVYEIFDLAPFSGTIEHQGSVFFNSDAIEVGDFSIGFDAGRISTDNSGFFVESTTGLEAILFDVENPTTLDAGESLLQIEADLLVSPEFATVLGNGALAGADVGDALISGTAAIPEPSSAIVLSVFGFAFAIRRRS